MFRCPYRIMLFVTGLFNAAILHAQSFPGYNSSHYAGIHGVPFNPASAAGTRYRWDVNIAGIDVRAGNTYLSFLKSSLRNDTLRRYVDYFPDTSATRRQFAWGSADLMLPSALYSIDERQSVAFTWRVRASGNAGNFATSTANFFLRYPNPAYTDRNFAEEYTGNFGHAWNEFGLTYARVIKDEGMHRWKVGITLKYLGGQAAGYLVGRDASFVLNSPEELQINSGRAYVAYNEQMAAWDGEWQTLYSPFQNPGIGADIGIIYEWRPDADGFGDIYEEGGNWNPDADAWKVRIGLSIVDIGGIKYTKAPVNFDLDMTTPGIPPRSIEKQKGESIDRYLERLNSMFTLLPSDETFFMNLPTAANLMGDYNIDGRFFVSATATIGLLGGKKDDHKNKALTQAVITPRYERKLLAAYLPIAFNEYGQADVGLVLRAGPLVIGSASLFSNLMRSRLDHADAFVALRLIPIHFSKWSWDKGNGGIFRRKNKNLGCPI